MKKIIGIIFVLLLIGGVIVFAPIYQAFNIFLILVVCLVFSLWDIKGLSVGKRDWKVEISNWLTNGHFWLLVSVNVFFTLFFYFYLGVTGGIRYDNPMSVFILSLVLATVLRVTFFHPLIGRHYDNLTLWVYDNIGTYSESEINLIAYYNNTSVLGRFLETISHDIPDREKRIRMRVRMEEILKSQTKTELSIRKSLARLLLQYPLWYESVTRFNFPVEFSKKEVDYMLPFPEEVIDQAARRWDSNKDKEKQINDKLKKLSEKPTSPELIDGREYRRLERLEKIKKSSVYNMREKITLLFLLKEYEFLQNIEENFFRKSRDVRDESLKDFVKEQKRGDMKTKKKGKKS